MRIAHKLTILILLVLATAAHAAMASATSSVMVVVREQHELVQRGSDMLLKVRLSPGVKASVWVDTRCDLPSENAVTITQSGSYVLPITGIRDRGDFYSCMVSSDGRLSAAVPLQ
jgi:hypothetical protein